MNIEPILIKNQSDEMPQRLFKSNIEGISKMPKPLTSPLTNSVLITDLVKSNSFSEKKKNAEQVTPGFKLIWILNHLSKMELNMNICYRILEKTNFEENINLEDLLNNILNLYFTEELLVQNLEENEENKQDVINRIFSNIFKKEKVDSSSNNKNKFSHFTSSNLSVPKTKSIKQISIVVPDENKKLQDENENKNLNHNVIININENLKTCLICIESKSLENFYTLTKTQHEFCKTCLIDHLKEKIMKSDVLSIKCPDGCGEFIEDSDIQEILKKEAELLNKYEKFKNIALLNQDPNVRWCVTPECFGYMKVQDADKENTLKLVCGICNQAMCHQCRNFWHEGKNCEEAMNLDFKNYIERVKVKECPKCKTKIEKNDGCNHMTCTRCHYQFCWLCCKKYSRTHYKWYNLFGCPRGQFYRNDQRPKINYFGISIQLFFVFLFALILLAFGAVVAPVALIGAGLYINFMITWEVCNPRNDCCRFFTVILGIMCAIVFLPITIVLEIFPGSCILFYKEILKR